MTNTQEVFIIYAFQWKFKNCRELESIHSQTTRTRFRPFLTTHLPNVDKYEHFFDHLPMSTWTFMDPPSICTSKFEPTSLVTLTLHFGNNLEIDDANICSWLCNNWSDFQNFFFDERHCEFWNSIFSVFLTFCLHGHLRDHIPTLHGQSWTFD